jgi:hypothetical protein
MDQVMMKRSRFPRYLLVFAAAGICASFGSHGVAAADSGTCAGNAASRQLDFWLGEWAVAGPDGKLNGTSRVYLALDKCLVIENWRGSQGHAGENVFAYSRDEHGWHGMFTDNEGRVHVFLDGKVTSGSAVFSGPSHGPNGETVLNRISIVRGGSKTVTQLWQKSADNGATWSTEYRGEYSRSGP